MSSLSSSPSSSAVVAAARGFGRASGTTTSPRYPHRTSRPKSAREEEGGEGLEAKSDDGVVKVVEEEISAGDEAGSAVSSSKANAEEARQWIENWRRASAERVDASAPEPVPEAFQEPVPEAFSEPEPESKPELEPVVMAAEIVRETEAEEGDDDDDGDGTAEMDDAEEEEGAVVNTGGGYVPGKELFGLTGGWMGGELGLKTPEGFERAVSETMQPAASTAAPSDGESKTVNTAAAATTMPSAGANVSPGKTYGGMAGGWPLGEVGLKEFNSSGRLPEAEDNALSVYLPLAIVSLIVAGGFASFFFGVDVQSIPTTVQAALTTVVSDGASGGAGGGARIGLSNVLGESPSAAKVAGGVALSLLGGLLVIRAVERGVNAATEKLVAVLKLSALAMLAGTLAYKILTE